MSPTVPLSQAFDAAGNRTSMATSVGSTLDFANTYAFDALNRLTEVIQQSQTGGNGVTAKRVAFGYNALSQQTSIERFQSTSSTNPVASTSFTFDTLNRLSTIAHAQDATTLNDYGYSYDGLSRITSIGSFIEGLSTYTHDAAGQLTAADHTSQTDEAYAYTNNGSRSGTGYTVGTNNQTTAASGVTFTYDDEGNRLTRTDTVSGAVEEYSWDYRNRLTQVIKRASSGGAITLQVNYAYDHLNRLVRRTEDADGSGSGTATEQFWVYDEGINAVLEFDGPAAGDLAHRYLWQNKVDQLLADEQITTAGSAGNVLWALTDHLGTIRDIADLNESTGITAIANHRTYDAFGNLTAETDAAINLLYGFTGKQFDEATNLQHNLNRWYDPELGQWLSEDPLGHKAGDENLRRYVKNVSTSRKDSLGLIGGGAGGDDDGLDNYNGDKTEEEIRRYARDSHIKDIPGANGLTEIPGYGTVECVCQTRATMMDRYITNTEEDLKHYMVSFGVYGHPGHAINIIGYRDQYYAYDVKKDKIKKLSSEEYSDQEIFDFFHEHYPDLRARMEVPVERDIQGSLYSDNGPSDPHFRYFFDHLYDAGVRNFWPYFPDNISHYQKAMWLHEILERQKDRDYERFQSEVQEALRRMRMYP